MGAGTVARGWLCELLPARGGARVLAVLTFVQSLGMGVFLTSSAVFFTTVMGLGAEQVGLGLSVAGLCGALVSVPAGRLADRFGARYLLILAYVASGLLFALYATVNAFASFLVVSCLIAACEGVSDPLRATLIYAVTGGGAAATLRGQLRSVFNLGFVLGTALAGAALVTATRTAFCVVVLATAGAQLACAGIAARLRDDAKRVVAGAQRRRRPMRCDVQFLLLTLVNGALELHVVIVTLGFPLWIVTHTSVSGSLNSLLLAVNTVIVVLLQVVVGRRASTVPDAARFQCRAGLVLAIACAVAALSGSLGPTATAWVLVGASVVLVFGELLQTASSFTLSFELPPLGRQGEYQGVFSLRKGLRQTVGPALVTWLVVGVGTYGWLVLGGLFVVFGMIGKHISLKMARSRQHDSPSATAVLVSEIGELRDGKGDSGRTERPISCLPGTPR